MRYTHYDIDRVNIVLRVHHPISIEEAVKKCGFPSAQAFYNVIDRLGYDKTPIQYVKGKTPPVKLKKKQRYNLMS